MPPPPALTRRLWNSIAGLHDQIVAHPFLAGLADGALDRDKFRFCVVQDALYLRDYARALSVCGARAPAEGDVAMFNQHAAGAIAVERELHAGFLADFGLTPAEVEATPTPSWPGSTGASPPPAATSGCSGTPPGARSAGPSRAGPARRGRRRPGG
jgi:TENA/THI-4/PQQC family